MFITTLKFLFPVLSIPGDGVQLGFTLNVTQVPFYQTANGYLNKALNKIRETNQFYHLNSLKRSEYGLFND
jgi:hypothetical protein